MKSYNENLEELIIAAKTALILKGSWGTEQEELDWIKDIFGLGESIGKHILVSLQEQGKITLKSIFGNGLWEQLKTGHKVTYNPENFSLKTIEEAVKSLYKK